jgi:hypothetical protein
MLAGLRQVPLLIVALFAADLVLVIVAVVDYAIGRPIQRLSILFILGNEGTVPTWHSSMQWLCAGVMFGLFAAHALRTGMRGALSIAALALACLVFSIDEVAQIHERLGSVANDLLLDRPRRAIGLWATGLWPFVVGIPAIAVLAVIVRGARHVFLTRASRALVLLTAGFVIMFTGAVVIELGANLLDETGRRDGSFLTQVVVEELMEMLGVTLVVWSGLSLLLAHGFRLRMPIAVSQRRADVTAIAAACASARSADSSVAPAR